jgi:hypothetical protein
MPVDIIPVYTTLSTIKHILILTHTHTHCSYIFYFILFIYFSFLTSNTDRDTRNVAMCFVKSPQYIMINYFLNSIRISAGACYADGFLFMWRR